MKARRVGAELVQSIIFVYMLQMAVEHENAPNVAVVLNMYNTYQYYPVE
jgi:hypothetical protein